MKKILLFIFLLVITLSQKSFAQNLAQKQQYGYVNGVRLDSVQAIYADADPSGVLAKMYNFTFEQGKGRVDSKIKDKDGNVLYFANTAIALNFFDYNGWSLFYLFSSNAELILKKK